MKENNNNLKKEIGPVEMQYVGATHYDDLVARKEIQPVISVVKVRNGINGNSNYNLYSVTLDRKLRFFQPTEHPLDLNYDHEKDVFDPGYILGEDTAPQGWVPFHVRDLTARGYGLYKKLLENGAIVPGHSIIMINGQKDDRYAHLFVTGNGDLQTIPQSGESPISVGAQTLDDMAFAPSFRVHTEMVR